MKLADLANWRNVEHRTDPICKQVLWILCLFIPVVVSAQVLEWQEVSMEEYPVGFLGIAQDKYGYIWLSDNGNGLYKFDGINTTVYKPEPANPNSVLSGRIENVFIDSEGIHWLLYFDVGMDRFDSETEQFVHFQHNEQDSTSLCSNGTRDIVEDLNGDLWIGTNAGLDKFDKQTGKFIHHFSNDPDAIILRSEQIRKLYIDKSGIIWIGAGSAFFGEESEGGLFSLNPNTGEINVFRHTEDENSLTDNRVRGIFEDSRGVFWVGTAGDGLHTMNRKRGTFQRHSHDTSNPNKLSRPAIRNNFSFGVDHITFIAEDDEGCILIGTFGNGINRYNPKTEKIDHFSINAPSPFKTETNSYWTCLKTNDGLLWFMPFGPRSGSNALAVLDLMPNRLSFFDNDGTYEVAQSKDSTIFLGTGKGVQVFSGDSLKYLFRTNGKEEDSSPFVTDIKFDDNDNLWVATAGAGLFSYNQKRQELKKYTHEPGNPNSLSSDYLGNIVFGDAGRLFIGTAEGLDIYTPKSNVFEHFKLQNPDLTTNAARFGKLVEIDQQQRIWIAGIGGVFRFDLEKGTFKKYDLGLGSELVRGLLEDKSGKIWIGTVNHGVRRYDDATDSFEPILDETGYLTKYQNIHSITQAGNGDIWIATRLGFVKYESETNQGTLFDNTWTPEISRAWDATGIFPLYSGEIIFGLEDGYYRFQPNDFIKKDSNIRKPFIYHLRIANEALTFSELEKQNALFDADLSLDLSHDQNDISFEIGYIDFRNNQKSKVISYKLENYDPIWRSASSGDLISYPQLRPGDYTFSAKVQDSYGNWGERNFALSIASPWYQRWWAWLLYVLATLLLMRSYIGVRSQRLSRENKILEEKVSLRTKQLQQSYDDLKSTQSQLIQAEKMASLGELTAGIAHEIQNPLNFVNNFSEINEELVDELEEELKAGRISEALDITKNIRDNEGKINHHGKRADAIIKGMLLHSRGDHGAKESTDVNVLVDEYLRLAYHGLRAKDKSFTASLNTSLDPEMATINIIRADVGRVFLNLINNAFHSIFEKAKVYQVGAFQPTITVSTREMRDHVIISIKDNGQGIPADIRDKIFQPFFTTKPAGHGTGLGLSLSYDIIKAHGGEIVVESDEGQGTEFKIILPR